MQYIFNAYRNNGNEVMSEMCVFIRISPAIYFVSSLTYWLFLMDFVQLNKTSQQTLRPEDGDIWLQCDKRSKCLPIIKLPDLSAMPFCLVSSIFRISTHTFAVQSPSFIYINFTQPLLYYQEQWRKRHDSSTNQTDQNNPLAWIQQGPQIPDNETALEGCYF